MSYKKETNLVCVLLIGMIFLCFAQRDLYAGLSWEQNLVVVEVGLEDATASAVFRCTNTGDYPLSVTVMQLPHGIKVDRVRLKSIRPGESREFTATCQVARVYGAAQWNIELVTDEPGAEPHVLGVRVKRPQIIRAEGAGDLVWRVGDEAESKTISLTVDYNKPVELSLSKRPQREGDEKSSREKEAPVVEQVSGGFKSELKVVKAGKQYELVVTPISTERNRVESIVLDSDLPDTIAPMMRYRAMIVPAQRAGDSEKSEQDRVNE